MPSQGFERLIERAISDEAFAARLQTDAEGAIAEYDLTAEEARALRAGDPAQLEAMGLDVRVSKLIIEGGKH